MRRQHRHRPYYTERRRKRSAALRPLITFVLVGALVLFGGRWVLGNIGFGGAVQRVAVLLTPEEKGIVRVSLDKGDWKRASQQIKLYPGDRIETGAGTHATVSFFDGTFARLDENTIIQITESKSRAEGESELSIAMEQGSIWIATPSSSVYGSRIARTISTPLLRTNLLAKTEAVIHRNALTLFDGDGAGSTVNIAGRSDSILVGEGQRLFLPDGEVDAPNLYSYRSALDPRAILSPFIEESRRQFTGQNPEPATPKTPKTSDNNGLTLSVRSPMDEEEVFGSTVLVEGTYNQETVSDVQVNGYGAELSGETFSVELAINDEEDIQISIEAIASNGDVLDKVVRTIHKNLTPPNAPHFSFPAKDGEVFETSQGKLQLIGTVGDDAVGIIVNDYRLQLFTPKSGEWKYLANVAYDNYHYGRNVFSAVAINKAGLKSEPTIMTIILKEEGEEVAEGVIGESDTPVATGTGEGREEEGVINNEDELPTNDPLAPGSISVSSPSAGTQHAAVGMDESDLLIEGLAPQGTETIWVNGYRLRLFEPAKSFWNYIASIELGTLKRGNNEYIVTARNADGQIIDTLTYSITFDAVEE